MRAEERTKVGIVGAGPAGLFLSHLLARAGIDSVIVEARSRAYVEGRVRAGVLEHWVTDLMVETGIGERMRREGLVHRGINLCFDGGLHALDFEALVGRHVTVYGQTEVVKDLIAARLAEGARVLFEAADASVHDLESEKPVIRYQHDGATHTLRCDFIAGCDGFHGICRASIPPGVLTLYDRAYPFGWLGILSESPPPDDELIYAWTERGFALYSMRSPTLSRLYIQCAPDEDIADWSDARIWDELHKRLGGVKPLAEGPVRERLVAPMRSFVAEPMRHGRLFLAGDAAHIVPPTGAKGLNLAVADVAVLARALQAFYRSGETGKLEQYSATCLRRVWKAQRFSWWMTQMLHLDPAHGAFDRRRQRAELDYVAGSQAAAKSLAENYVGLRFE